MHASLPTQRRLEVVATSLADVRAAVEGGADRLELAGSHTAQGATTPSLGFMVTSRRLAPRISLVAMIRPRLGPFVYAPEEVEQMELDIAAARSASLEGVMFGAVTTQQTLDTEVMERLLRAASGLRVCVNMAFDRCRDPFEALHWLIQDGRVERVLTAGGAPTALAGQDRIGELLEQSAGRMAIMPGTGIDTDTLPELLSAVPAISEVHVSAGARSSAAGGWVDAEVVAQLRRQLEQSLAAGAPAAP
jgi:copper homeostasis protein